MIIDFSKDIYNTGGDILLLKDSNAIIESIKNFIELNILDIPLTTSNSISARNMLLKASNNIEIRSIIYDIKNIIETNITEVKSCEITYTDKKTHRTIDISVVLQNIKQTNNLPYNIVLRI
jgi:hypothetical protein